MLDLFYRHDPAIDKAYIVTIKGHEKSEAYSQRCQESCVQVGMPYTVWDAYDGTGDDVVEPDHSRDCSVMSMLKLADHDLTNGELGCALSHISLWVHCAKINKPIVALEHDAVMVRPYTEMLSYNSIVYLGCSEWASGRYEMYPIPLLGCHGHNNRFLLRTHAYAIDPPMAKNLISHVLRNGVWMIADRMMRADLFNITHHGLYAYDAPAETSIVGREMTNKRYTKDLT